MGITKLLEALVDMLPCNEVQWNFKKTKGVLSSDMKKILQLLKQIIRIVSGDDLSGILLDMYSRSELWETLVGKNLGDSVNNLDEVPKKQFVGLLVKQGWKPSDLLGIGICAGYKLRTTPEKANTGGRPATVTPEIKRQVADDHREASTPTCRKLFRESKEREEDVHVARMHKNYHSVYANSELKGVISETTYRALRPNEFKKLTRRTDVCDYCEAGRNTRQQLKQLTTSHNFKLNWSLEGTGLELLGKLKTYGVPESIKPTFEKLVDQMIETDSHEMEYKRQNKCYSDMIKNPENSSEDEFVLTKSLRRKRERRENAFKKEEKPTKLNKR